MRAFIPCPAPREGEGYGDRGEDELTGSSAGLGITTQDIRPTPSRLYSVGATLAGPACPPRGRTAVR
ncbi:MAG: hypothetical protein M3Q03_07600, partial [Chloroflexota bacterium]|nr:hypothetical protein [Chloroflexota bacterium]